MILSSTSVVNADRLRPGHVVCDHTGYVGIVLRVELLKTSRQFVIAILNLRTTRVQEIERTDWDLISVLST